MTSPKEWSRAAQIVRRIRVEAESVRVDVVSYGTTLKKAHVAQEAFVSLFSELAPLEFRPYRFRAECALDEGP